MKVSNERAALRCMTECHLYFPCSIFKRKTKQPNPTTEMNQERSFSSKETEADLYLCNCKHTQT